MKIKIGDKVRVVKRVEAVYDSNGILKKECRWDEKGEMDKLFGIEGIVISKYQKKYEVEFNNDDFWCFLKDCLELVEGKKTVTKYFCHCGEELKVTPENIVYFLNGEWGIFCKKCSTLYAHYVDGDYRSNIVIPKEVEL